MTWVKIRWPRTKWPTIQWLTDGRESDRQRASVSFPIEEGKLLDSDPSIRRPSGIAVEAPVETLRVGSLQIDTARRIVLIDGRKVELTAKEFDLLLHLARRPGRVFTREQLIGAVWGASYGGYHHAVSSMVNRLRAKIEMTASEHRYLETVGGVGYCFHAPEAA